MASGAKWPELSDHLSPEPIELPQKAEIRLLTFRKEALEETYTKTYLNFEDNFKTSNFLFQNSRTSAFNKIAINMDME